MALNLTPFRRWMLRDKASQRRLATLGITRLLPMHCSFTLSQADFIALHKVINRRLTQLSSANSKLFFSNLFIWVPFGIAFASYAALFRKYPDMTYDLTVVAAALAIGITLVIAGAFLKQRIYRKVMLSAESWFLSEQTVNIDSSGLAAKGAYGEAHYTWSAFRHLVEDDRNLYLFIDNSQAFVLPKAALGTPDQLAHVKAWLPS